LCGALDNLYTCHSGAGRNPEDLKKLFLFISLCGTKKRTKEKPPRRFASRLKSGFPRRAHDRGVVMNSHIWALGQHNDPAPLSCTRLGCAPMGLKVKIPNLKI